MVGGGGIGWRADWEMGFTNGSRWRDRMARRLGDEIYQWQEVAGSDGAQIGRWDSPMAAGHATEWRADCEMGFSNESRWRDRMARRLGDEMHEWQQVTRPNGAQIER